MAASEGSTAGAVLSRLARVGLISRGHDRGGSSRIRIGVPVFPGHKGEVVSLEHVQKLPDEEGLEIEMRAVLD